MGAYFRKATYDAISSQAFDCVVILLLDVEPKNDWNEREKVAGRIQGPSHP